MKLSNLKFPKSGSLMRRFTIVSILICGFIFSQTIDVEAQVKAFKFQDKLNESGVVKNGSAMICNSNFITDGRNARG